MISADDIFSNGQIRRFSIWKPKTRKRKYLIWEAGREREVKGLDLKDLEWGRKDGFFAAIFSTEAKSMRGENKNTRSARIAVAEDGLLDSGHGVPEMKDGDRIPA